MVPKYEFAIDLRQWVVGFNSYPDWGTNIFIGPLRLSIYPERMRVWHNETSHLS